LLLLTVGTRQRLAAASAAPIFRDRLAVDVALLLLGRRRSGTCRVAWLSVAMGLRCQHRCGIMKDNGNKR